MKIDPGFTSHWKTRRLLAACGPEAVLGLLALWGDCQIRRRWQGLDLTARKVAAIMRCDGDAEKLWAALTDPDCPWLDPEPDGTWTVHGFEEHQTQVISMWRNGSKGGRKSSPAPPPNTKPYSYSSSYPGCEPDGTAVEPDGTARFAPVSTPALEEVLAAAKMLSVSEERATIWFHEHEARPITPAGEWTDRSGRPVRNWRSALKAWDGKWTANEARNGSHRHQNTQNSTKKPASVWELKQRIEAAEKELARVRESQSSKDYLGMGEWKLKPEAAKTAKALRAKIDSMRAELAGAEAAA